MKGKAKKKHFGFSKDLMKIQIKAVKELDSPPKLKYVIETSTVKQIIKGHGTDAFRKTKGIFRSIPPRQNCFTIIGPTTTEGLKSFNIQCEKEKDVDNWINVFDEIIVYMKKIKVIKNNVIIKKLD